MSWRLQPCTHSFHLFCSSSCFFCCSRLSSLDACSCSHFIQFISRKLNVGNKKHLELSNDVRENLWEHNFLPIIPYFNVAVVVVFSEIILVDCNIKSKKGNDTYMINGIDMMCQFFFIYTVPKHLPLHIRTVSRTLVHTIAPPLLAVPPSQ